MQGKRKYKEKKFARPWHGSLTLDTQNAEAGRLQVQEQAEILNEFYAYHGTLVRPCLKV